MGMSELARSHAARALFHEAEVAFFYNARRITAWESYSIADQRPLAVPQQFRNGLSVVVRRVGDPGTYIDFPVFSQVKAGRHDLPAETRELDRDNMTPEAKRWTSEYAAHHESAVHHQKLANQAREQGDLHAEAEEIRATRSYVRHLLEMMKDVPKGAKYKAVPKL